MIALSVYHMTGTIKLTNCGDRLIAHEHIIEQEECTYIGAPDTLHHERLLERRWSDNWKNKI